MVYYKIVADGKSIDVEVDNFITACDMARGFSALSGNVAEVYMAYRTGGMGLCALVMGQYSSCSSSANRDGWIISRQVRFGDDSRHIFLQRVFKGMYIWNDDALYGKRFSVATVKKHLLELAKINNY